MECEYGESGEFGGLRGPTELRGVGLASLNENEPPELQLAQALDFLRISDVHLRRVAGV